MNRTRLLFAALAACLASGPVCAESPPTVEQVRIGLPTTGRSAETSGRSRSSAWAPVAVLVKSGSAGHPQNAYRLRIETTDLEEQTYQITVPVPAMSANNEGTVMGYIVPGSDSATFKVQLETVEGQVVSVKDKISRDTTKGELVADLDVLFLGVGSGLNGLKAAGEKLDKAAEGKADANQPEDALRGRRQFAFADDVTALPDRWYGYDAVDVVMLATGKVDFVNALASGDSESDAGRRRSALLEWVRRGGQVVLSVGRNQQQVGELLRKMPLIRVEFDDVKPVAVPTLSLFAKLAGHDPLRKIEVVTLKPGSEARSEAHVIVREEGVGPILMQASCGLGRVVLVCFDLDSGELAAWKGQEEFWKQLQLLVSPYLAKPRDANGPGVAGVVFRPNNRGGGGWNVDDTQDFRSDFKRRLETFEDIPVISFGWVALFLLLFILLVGPLDYFLLKKVFKRLELTWVTFPLIVIAASVAAYFAAYSMKGEELRVNKIDLIDVDLSQPQFAYGHSWFTLFSPRAQSYTVGAEPAAGTWTAAIPPGSPGPVVTLLEGGDNTRRQASQGLFKKPYLYADEAAGLQYVPVPVWSTRSFTASWRAPLIEKKPPVGITDDVGPIRQARDGSGPTGRLTNNLPVPLKDVCLFYQGKWYLVGDLAPDEQKRIETFISRDARVNGREIDAFFNEHPNNNAPVVLKPGTPLASPGWRVNAQLPERTSFTYVKKMMFFQRKADGTNNAGVRRFDQSWRLNPQPQAGGQQARYRDEIILAARAPMLTGKATWVNEHAATGSRLWLGKLPASGEEAPAVSGVLLQETYLRVFIPVRAKE